MHKVSNLHGGIFYAIFYFKSLADCESYAIYKSSTRHGGKSSAISPSSASGGGNSGNSGRDEKWRKR